MSMESMSLQPNEPVSDWSEVPEQRGPYIPALARGRYQFQLPHNLTADKWKEEKVEAKDGKPEKVHFRVSFDQDLPLVVKAGPEGTPSDSIFRGNVSTRPLARFVGKRGDPPQYVSDALYLYKKGLKGDPVNPADDKAVRDGICKKAGSEFVATVVWETYCSKKKVRYVLDAQGNSVEDPTGKMGCGKNYRDGKTIDVATGLVSERFICTNTQEDGTPCGAALRVFPSLANFGPVE